MPDFPTSRDLFLRGRNEALWRNRQLSLQEIERQGSDLNILVAAAAAMGDECVGLIAQLSKNLYGPTASGPALTRLILDRYPGLTRKEAAPSYGYAEFSCTTAPTVDFDIAAGTLLSTPQGTQFITEEDATIAAGTTGPVEVSIRSVFAGATQKATSGSITSILTAFNNPPTGLSVTNPSATFGGEDQERDTDYYERSKSFWSSARRGTLGAIEQGILATGGVTRATVFEHYDTLGRPIGYVQAVVADSFTDSFISQTVPDAYVTQKAVLASRVQTNLEEYRSAGVGVQIVVASVVLQSIRLSLSFVAGADEDAVKAIVRTLAVEYVNGLAPGETLNVSRLQQAISTVTGLYYTGDEVLTPAGNVVPQPGEVLRTPYAKCVVL